MSDRIAVMFDGEIAQLSDAETLYRRPKSRRVAEFIGTMNFLPATVIAESDDVVEVDAQGFGRMTLAADQVGADAGHGTSVGFRPETLTIIQDAPIAGGREVPAIIEEVVYYGDMTYYDVRIEGTERAARLSMRNTFNRAVLDRGAAVRIAWSPAALILFR